MSSSHGNSHFFKKIEEDTLRNGELRIPRSFVNKCWEGISNPVYLMLPNGDKQCVKWKKIDADVWLIEDWKKFAEAYSLDHDHLLVFKYVGKSQFEVVMFDQSGLEMGYPLIDGNFLRRSKRAKSPLPFSPSSSTKKVKINPRKEPSCSGYPNQDVETKRAQSRRTNRVRRKNRRCSKSKTNQNEGSSAVERAEDFCSQSDNSTFLCEMRRSYIKRHTLAMPRDFATVVQQLKVGDSVTLRTLDDKTWFVKVYLNRSNRQITLSHGWKEFAKENNLKIKDACVFEQIKLQEFSFRVHIFRDGQESSSSIFPAYEDGTNRNYQRGLQDTIAQRGNDGIPKKYMGKNVFDDSEIPGKNNEVSLPANRLTLSINPNPSCDMIKNLGIDNVNDVSVTLQIGERSWPARLV